MTSRKHLTIALAISAGSAVGTASSPASAGVMYTDCAPTSIYWNSGSSGSHVLSISCVGGDSLGGYQSGLPSSGSTPYCSTNHKSVETLKVWHSMAQASLLAGKRLDITWYTSGSCGTLKVIQYMSIRKQ